MSEKESEKEKKEPEVFVAFKIYKNGKLTIAYKGKEITRELASPATAMILGALALDALTQGATRGIESALDEIFKEKKEGEKKDDSSKKT